MEPKLRVATRRTPPSPHRTRADALSWAAPRLVHAHSTPAGGVPKVVANPPVELPCPGGEAGSLDTKLLLL